MKLQKSFKLALNILVHSKLRSWLTIIGIVIGVASVVAIVSIGEGAQASIQERLGGLGADIITVSPGFSRASGGFRGGPEGERTSTTTSKATKNLTQKDVQVIKSIEGVAFINGIVSGRGSMTYLAQTASVSIEGVDALAWKNIITTELESGRYLDPGDTNSIVIGNRIAKSMFKQQLAPNMAVTIEGKSFKIVGILKASGGGFGGGGGDNNVFMPVATARELLRPGSDDFDSISVKVSDPNMVELIVNETDSKLMLSRHVTARTKDFTVTSSQQLQSQIASVTGTLTTFLAAIAAVSLLVGAVGIANTLFTSVLEKTKEIGIMKAIGARNSDIMTIFLLNAGLVGLTGGLIGIGLGSGISMLLPNFLSRLPFGGGGANGTIRTVLPFNLLISALLLSVSIGLIAGAIPAYRASRLKPVDALRYE